METLRRSEVKNEFRRQKLDEHLLRYKFSLLPHNGVADRIEAYDQDVAGSIVTIISINTKKRNYLMLTIKTLCSMLQSILYRKGRTQNWTLTWDVHRGS